MAQEPTTSKWQDFPIPALMRAARGVYAQAIRAELHAIGVDDMPRNGMFVLANIDATGGTRAELPAELGITKQAVSQVVDVLVDRGYLERRPVPADRRRVDLVVTERGRQALEAGTRGVEDVDRQLLERVPAGHVGALRDALSAFADIKVQAIDEGKGRRRAKRQFRSASPVFPVADVPAALAHYASLGFRTSVYEGGDDYGFADREGVGLHFSRCEPEGDGDGAFGERGCAYLYVGDADALYEEWTRPGIGGETHPVGPTDYKLREGAHVDPDGNLLRFGSPMESADGAKGAEDGSESEG